MGEFSWPMYLADASDTLALGARLGLAIDPPLTCNLGGDLGAGKTTLVRGFLRGLGHTGKVKSPTYGLVEHYQTDRCDVVHMDLYRLGHPQEVEFLALRDLYTQRSVVMVEWPERAARYLPNPDLVLHFEVSGNGRTVTCMAHSQIGETCLARMRNQST